MLTFDMALALPSYRIIPDSECIRPMCILVVSIHLAVQDASLLSCQD
jgi:hypothetical protein